MEVDSLLMQTETSVTSHPQHPPRLNMDLPIPVRSPNSETVLVSENLSITNVTDFKVGTSNLDSWKCNIQGNGMFSTTTIAQLVDDKLLSIPTATFETERNKLLPQKIGLFIWRVRLNRIPDRFELDKRGIDIDSLRCPVCDNGNETIDHIFLRCSFAKDVWDRVYKWWNLGSFPHNNLEGMFKGFKHVNRSTSPSKLWQAIERYSGYIIWQNRNQIIFRKKKNNGPMALNKIHIKTFEWISSGSSKLKLDWSQ
ncbi:uncharacterized protein [Rutidosis leptorrhynchoides]|uniref:uncharacterized protein n=1 Tax=Rutidosis leptorrhynchoides TaxID=125765 RepID=UPI003A98E277